MVSNGYNQTPTLTPPHPIAMITRVLRLLTVLCLALTCSLPGAIGQLDTEFWFAAPEVWANHGDQPILLRFSTLAEAAQVTVDQPANPTFPVQTLNISANGTQTLDLTPWIDDIEIRRSIRF